MQWHFNFLFSCFATVTRRQCQRSAWYLQSLYFKNDIWLSSQTDLRDARRFADFSYNCARIPNIFRRKVCPIKDVINFSQLSDWDAFKTCLFYLASSKVSGLVACKQRELRQLYAFTSPDSEGYNCEYPFNWPIRDSMMVSSAMGKTNVPQIWHYVI